MREENGDDDSLDLYMRGSEGKGSKDGEQGRMEYV